MAVKNFVFFWENWVVSKVNGMKTTFFAIFDPTLTHILAPKGPNKYHSARNILVKKDGNYIINFVTLTLTELKFLKIISFLPFLSQIEQKFDPDVVLMWHF